MLRLIQTAAVSCVFRRRQRQTHAISADARGKLEKFLISKKNCGTKKYAANCGRVNEPLPRHSGKFSRRLLKNEDATNKIHVKIFIGQHINPMTG